MWQELEMKLKWSFVYRKLLWVGFLPFFDGDFHLATFPSLNLYFGISIFKFNFSIGIFKFYFY